MIDLSIILGIKYVFVIFIYLRLKGSFNKAHLFTAA